MDVPSDGFSLITYLALVVPGIVFVSVRVRLRGYIRVDTQLGARVLLAFVVSAVFDAVYAAIFGPYLVNRSQTGEAPSGVEISGWSLLYLGLAVVIPVVAAWFIYTPSGAVRRIQQRLLRLGESSFDSSPTAWDQATTTTGAEWVRVRIGPGDWIGGRFANATYFSTYPEPRDLFIQEQWFMGKDGSFIRPVPNGAGQWVSVQDNYIVDWVFGIPDTLGVAEED